MIADSSSKSTAAAVEIPITPTPIIADAAYSIREAAHAARVAEITIHRALANNRLGCCRCGRRVIIFGRHLLDWLRSGEVPPKAASR